MNTKQKEFTFSSAGHPSQVFISERKIVELERTGKLIGFVKKSTYSETTFPYSSGEKLFLFSDGLFEEMNNKNELFGEDKIRKIIQQHENASISFIMNLILQELETHLANRLVQDDITFVGIQLSY
ncbi:MAG: serine/threonine-protein phosphatase [Leptospiraceae bacterium]|nr:serine/threonine-protein phosphatase [Leptospiraceae bacterium]